MEGRSAVWLLAALLLDLISAQDQNSLKYLEVGGKLVLRPEPRSGSIRSITWKLNGNMVGALDEFQPLFYSPPFRGRASVDKTTGVLEIRNMMKNDSGVYTLVINNNIQDGGYDVRVMKQVPKPVVMLTPETCTKQSKSCFLSCGGDVTDAGPVTFYFSKGDGDWKKNQQDIIVMNNATTQAFKTFSCRMKNPLALKDSEPVDNPFYVEGAARSNAGRIVGSVVVLLIAAVAAGVVLCSA